jgi:hypothetical protein
VNIKIGTVTCGRNFTRQTLLYFAFFYPSGTGQALLEFFQYKKRGFEGVDGAVLPMLPRQ